MRSANRLGNQTPKPLNDTKPRTTRRLQARPRALHHLLNLSDGDAARNQCGDKRQVPNTLAALITVHLRLQGLDDLVAALLLVT